MNEEELKRADLLANEATNEGVVKVERLRQARQYAAARQLEELQVLANAYLALRAQSEGFEQDAKRYRWLKANHLQTGADSWIRTGDDLEEAIDAMLLAAQGTEKGR